MLQIRLHGRGGQGAVVGCSIIGMAYFIENHQVQFFPEFGVERRGAPVQAFLRVSKDKILENFQIKKPDHLIIFDEGLIDKINVTKGLKKGGKILINSKKKPCQFNFSSDFKVATINADKISIENNLGTANAPIINCAIAGAFAKVMGNLQLKSLIESITQSVPSKVNENINAAKTAFESVIMAN